MPWQLATNRATHPADIVPTTSLNRLEPGITKALIGDQDRRGAIGQYLGECSHQVRLTVLAALLVVDLLADRQRTPGEGHRGAQKKRFAAVINR